MCLSIFLFLSELGTCPQNLIPTRGVEHWERNNFPQGGMLKSTHKGRFLILKKTYKKLFIENPNGEHILYCFLYTKKLFLKNTKIFIFGGISKFLNLIIFGQILANLGKFGQILLHWQWLTACPNLGWNLKTS
jgi:hypothetical protein